jgi:serine/threonine protein kinase
MSTYTSEPGTRLAGRYRLVDQMSAGTGWTFWKATDETLARSVTVLTFAPGFPRITEAVTAARAASRLNDSRFAQVFDVDDSDEIAYVVMEWVRGDTLLEMLAEGPLDPSRAVSLIVEAAQALAIAHRSGQAHLRLEPASLHWTPGGGVKIGGLGIDAALSGTELTEGDNPEVTDARDLGKLLYAALTGYWPGPDGTTLPPAPTDSDGAPCTPRQVSAEVPASIDSVTCRALFQQQNRQGPALSSPAEFADALAQVAPPAPPPPSAYAAGSYQQPDSTRAYRGSGPTNPYPLTDGTAHVPRGAAPAGYRRRHPASERSAVARAIVSAVIVLVLAAIGVTAWAISRSLHHSTPPPASRPQQSTSASPPAAAATLKPVSASVFNIQGSTDDPSGAGVVLSPSAGQYWHTEYYLGYPQFGHLKSGVGLILDMGRQVRLSQLNIQFGTACCTHATIEIGNSNTQSQSSLNSFTTVSSSTTAAGNTVFNVTSSATGRYVLIWLTYLPPLAGQANTYEAQIYDVTVRGSSA